MRRLGTAAYPLAALIGAIALWYGAVILFKVPPYLLPLPSAVYDRIASDFGFLLWQSLVTTEETLGGFALSIVLGVPIAIVLVASRTLDRALMPWLVLSQTFPK